MGRQLFTHPICSVVLHCSICGKRAQRHGSNAEVQLQRSPMILYPRLHNK
jgi:hypothetical protein